MEELTELVQKYSNFTQPMIDSLLTEIKNIQNNYSYRKFDVFIDVRNDYSHQAVVVYHKPPQVGVSLYQHKVVGKEALQENEPGVFHALETGLPSIGLLAETQENRLIHQRIYPIKFNDLVIGVTIVESDISNNILNSFRAKDTLERYNDVSATIQLFGRLDLAVTDQLVDSILVFDKLGNLVLANKTALELYKGLGYIGNIIGLDYNNLSLDGTNFKSILNHFLKVKVSKNLVEKKEFQYLDHYFTIRKLLNQENQQLIVLIQNVTEIKHKEAEIISKSVAIREVNHRVKNNLQSVISLLRIQQRRLESPELKQALNGSISRIMAIASTYELLAKQVSDDTNLASALNLLVSHFKQLNDTQNITVKSQIDSTIVIDSDRIVTISIIVNELLQNVVDHAFSHDQAGTIKLMGIIDHNIVTISVADDGSGFALDQVSTSSLGLTIIRSYVADKLKGKLKISSDSTGTTVAFSFNN
ncbi:sensor histidine kinase [Loigolactobacillus jiayinensis]|uniref:histidine kinase n=1 Tax=Loigolactobacillus jiayinensis TaxID=2486016 RepID=A0ABW1RI72_9LACO|nr:histidine kinase N-terminal domain-containing protein [Loigolactobacillus jiayinensis]